MIRAALTVNSVLAGWVPHYCPHLRPPLTPLTPLPSTLTPPPCIPFIWRKHSSQNTDSLAKEVSPNQRILGNKLNRIQTLFMYARYYTIGHAPTLRVSDGALTPKIQGDLKIELCYVETCIVVPTVKGWATQNRIPNMHRGRSICQRSLVGLVACQ